MKKLLKSRRVNRDFSSHQRDWENFEQENNSIALNVLFVSYNSEGIRLAYKSIYNKRKKQVILLMVNDEANNCYYFAIKKLSGLNSLGWLQGKKETIINNNNNNNYNNDFKNALDDVLDYQTIKKHPKRISKLKPYVNKYNWKGIEFPSGSKEWQKLEQNNKIIALNILHVKHNTKKYVAYRSKHNNKRKKQVILFMIGDDEKNHYLAVTSLSALFRRTSNQKEDFYCFLIHAPQKVNLKNMNKYVIIMIAAV